MLALGQVQTAHIDMFLISFTDGLQFLHTHVLVRRIYQRLYSKDCLFSFWSILVLAMFIGTGLKRMNLGSHGYGILIGWSLFVIILYILLEIANRKYVSSEPNLSPDLYMHNIGKTNWLLLHLIIHLHPKQRSML